MREKGGGGVGGGEAQDVEKVVWIFFFFFGVRNEYEKIFFSIQAYLDQD